MYIKREREKQKKKGKREQGREENIMERGRRGLLFFSDETKK